MNTHTLETSYSAVPSARREAWLRRRIAENAVELSWLKTRIVADFPATAAEFAPPPFRTFSKLRLVQALMSAGLWAQVKSWIEAQGLTDLYLAAQVFTDDDERFTRGLAALKAALGVSDEAADAILAQAEIK